MPQKKLFRKFLSFILFFLLLSTFLITIKFLFELFLVKKIVIIAEKKNPNLRLQKLSETPIFFIDNKKVEKALIDLNPYLKSVKIEKKLPSTIILYPEFYQSKAQLEINQGYFILSHNGRILEKTKTKYDDLLTINFYQKLTYQSNNVGEYITFNELIVALQLITDFENLNIKINSIDILGLNMIVFNLDKNIVIVNGEKDSKKTKYELLTVLRDLKFKKQEFKKLDLRFNKPIIVF
jgi:cell division septal protein FtsQ